MMENKSAQFPLLSKSMLSRPSSGILRERQAHRAESFQTLAGAGLEKAKTDGELDRITTNAARMNGEPCIRDLVLCRTEARIPRARGRRYSASAGLRGGFG